jgi:hypothetical protein
MSDWGETLTKIERLRNYAEYEGTEWGEMIMALCALTHRSDYVSEELAALLVAEIDSNLEWAEENLELVESVETFTRKVITVEMKQ